MTFEYERVKGAGDDAGAVLLANGDVSVLEGLMQKRYVHCLQPNKLRRGSKRINLTWRWIVSHQKKCPVR